MMADNNDNAYKAQAQTANGGPDATNNDYRPGKNKYPPGQYPKNWGRHYNGPRNKTKEQLHEHKEAQHDAREKERERILNGSIRPPPGAGPNWAKNRLAALDKFAKATKRRHKKHEKNMRKAEAAAQGAGIDKSEEGSDAPENEDRIGHRDVTGYGEGPTTNLVHEKPEHLQRTRF